MAKKAIPAYRRLPVKNQTITAAIMGIMKCNTVARSMIMMIPTIARIRKTISSPPPIKVGI